MDPATIIRIYTCELRNRKVYIGFNEWDLSRHYLAKKSIDLYFYAESDCCDQSHNKRVFHLKFEKLNDACLTWPFGVKEGLYMPTRGLEILTRFNYPCSETGILP